MDLTPATVEVTFFTISDSLFFLGTVALLNSLRITGHDAPLVVLDVGLNLAQRARLEAHTTVVDSPTEMTGHPVLFKPFPRFFDPHGVIVIIDSDMIVTSSLARPIELASKGKICVFPDHPSQAGRRSQEWESTFELKEPLRRQTYVNSGFIALSIEHWPDFLWRFWDLCERIPAEAAMTGRSPNNPFWAGDQDALNALLMSEMPPDTVELLPATHEAYPDRLRETKIVDAVTLECRLGGERPAILHYSMPPKAWDRRGWLRVRRDAYVRLFPRVVCGHDARLRLEPEELPLWLRPTLVGRITLAAIDVSHGLVNAIRRLMPARASATVLRAAQRLSHSTRS